MGLFRYYTRVFIRSHFRPINPDVAKRGERNSSYLYLITAWTTLVLTISYMKKSKGDNLWNMTVVDPYENMKRFSTTGECTAITLDGMSISTEKVKYEELDDKAKGL